MTRDIINAQRQRLDELCAIRRPLTEREINEAIKLARLEKMRNRAKDRRREDPEAAREQCRAWRRKQHVNAC